MKPLRSILICIALAVAGGIPAAMAIGATTNAPAVTTAPATSIGATGATLHGTVNPNGQQTVYAFQWGPTVGYGHETTPTSAGAGKAAASVSASLANLPPGSAVHFRMIATNTSGSTSVGADQTFATTGSAPAPSAAPKATSSAATNSTQSSLTLSGSVNPEGQQTTYWFEYGTTSSYGFETGPVSVGAGTADVTASAVVAGLAPGATYHFRLVAFSAGGTALGADETATTTTPPAVVTENASKPDSSSAVLNALVNPDGRATTYYFQYGTTTGYGLETLPVAVGSGSSSVAVHRHPEGLLASTTYHYRVVAQSSGGITYGADKTFITAGPASTPSTLKILGRHGFVSRNGWVGPVVGCFAGQTACTGRYVLMYRGAAIATRNFSMPAASGWPTVARLNSKGRRLIGDRYRHALSVELMVTTTSGQHFSEAYTLARWH